MSAEDVLGRWQLVSSENFDEFMKAIGVGLMMRMVANSVKPALIISQEGDTWHVRTESPLKTYELVFKLDEEFEQARLDGVKVKSIFTVVGDKLIEKQYGDKDITIVREIVDGELKATCTCDEVVSIRIYQKAD